MNNVKTGDLIRQCRKEKGLTQSQLAELLHITDRAVSKWERGLCAPDIALLEPLSKALGVSVVELIEGTRQETPSQTESAAITVIDYSNREIKANAAQNRHRIHMCIGVMVLTVCVVIFGSLFSSIRAQKADEALFMNHMYAKLNQIIWDAEAILEKDSTQAISPAALTDLCYALRTAAEELEVGYHYVSETVPSVASWWFSERAATISSNFQLFLTEQGTLSEDGVAYVKHIHSDVQQLRDSLGGEDGLNLNNALSLDAFCLIIFEFYQTQTS